MKVKITLSGNMLLIYKDRKEEIAANIEKPASVKEIILKVGINPFVVTSVLINGKRENKDFIISEDMEIILISPLAGG